MKLISVRDLRNRPGEVWKRLPEDDLVLTSKAGRGESSSASGTTIWRPL